MKRTIIALVLITITVASALAGSITYLAMINPQDNKSPSTSPLATSTPISDSSSQETNSASPTPTATQTTTSSPTSSSTPIATPAPPKPRPSTPAPSPTYAPDSAYPEGLYNWLPYGTLAVLSPTNQTYNITTLTLNVSGGLVIATTPSLSYSLDGGSRVPLTVELTKISMAQTSISASTSLTNLANGSHVLIVYGDLGFESRKAKIIVNFEILA